MKNYENISYFIFQNHHLSYQVLNRTHQLQNQKFHSKRKTKNNNISIDCWRKSISLSITLFCLTLTTVQSMIGLQSVVKRSYFTLTDQKSTIGSPKTRCLRMVGKPQWLLDKTRFNRYLITVYQNIIRSPVRYCKRDNTSKPYKFSFLFNTQKILSTLMSSEVYICQTRDQGKVKDKDPFKIMLSIRGVFQGGVTIKSSLSSEEKIHTVLFTKI